MLTGGCLCGSIRYAIEGELRHVANCHCTECRGSTGAPYVTFGVALRSGFRYTKGTPRRFASSPVDTRSFCPDCGTQLTFETSRAPKTIDVTIGSLDDAAAHAPEADIWVRSRLPWVARDGRLSSFEKER